MEGGAHDWYEEAVVEVVQKLGTDCRMCDLHHGVAELKRVHKEHEWRHTHPVLSPQGVPVVPANFNLSGQRGVEGAEARGQHLRRHRAARQ